MFATHFVKSSAFGRIITNDLLKTGNSKVNNTRFLKSSPGSRFFSSTNKVQQYHQRVSPLTRIMNEHSTALVFGAAGLIGTGALVVYGFQKAEEDNQFQHDKSVTSRLRYSFLYLGGGLALTAAVARGIFSSYAVQRFFMANPISSTIGSIVAMITSSTITRSISYQDSPIAKHLSWGSFNAIVGITLSPIVALGGSLLLRAAMATGCVVGGLSLVAASDPTESFLQLAGPLSIGLGVVVASSLGSIFFPASSLLSAICLYGGVAVFSGFVLVDTQKMIQRARLSPIYDPINSCIGLYMDTINLFVRIASIMSNNRRK